MSPRSTLMRKTEPEVATEIETSHVARIFKNISVFNKWLVELLPANELYFVSLRFCDCQGKRGAKMYSVQQ